MKKIAIMSFYVILTIILSASVFSYDGFSFELTDHERSEVTEGIHYDYFDFVSSGNPNKAFHAVLDPDSPNVEIVLHDVYPDQDTFQSGTLLEIAEDYEAKTGNKVYAGINGDFFWDHAPIDYYIKEGHVIQEGYHPEKESFGFNNDGDFAMGAPELDTIMNIEDEYFSVDSTDSKAPYPGEISVYKPNKTMHTIETSKYIVKANEATIERNYNLPLEGTLHIEEESFISDDAKVVPENHFGIAINAMAGDDENAEHFHALADQDDFIRITHGPVGDFEGLNYWVGGNNILVEDGQTMPYELKTSSSGEYWAPRTTLGITEDGDFFMTVIDGRNAGYSSGLTVPDQAQLAKDLGAKSALELDGGGSSTFLLRTEYGLEIMNRPSDGVQRKISNAVLFVESEPEDDDEDNQDENQDRPINDDDTGSDSSGRIDLRSLSGGIVSVFLLAFVSAVAFTLKRNIRG